jgi:hypothetical protein
MIRKRDAGFPKKLIPDPESEEHDAIQSDRIML